MNTTSDCKVILFGSPGDPTVSENARKLEAAGRIVEIQHRPNYDTGLGICGTHYCSCKQLCKAQYDITQRTTNSSKQTIL